MSKKGASFHCSPEPERLKVIILAFIRRLSFSCSIKKYIININIMFVMHSSKRLGYCPEVSQSSQVLFEIWSTCLDLIRRL